MVNDLSGDLPVELPVGWAWCRFGDVFTFKLQLVPVASYQDSPHIAPDCIEKFTGKLIGYKTVREDKVTSPKHLFSTGLILYSKIRPLLRKATIATFDGLCSADMYPLSTYLDVQYALHLLLSDLFNDQIHDVVASRVKMPKINQEELSHIFIPLPPLAEQKRIVAKIEKLMPLVERFGELEDRRLQLDADLPLALEKSILQEAIQGKLVKQNPNDEPASELLKRVAAERKALVKAGKIKRDKDESVIFRGSDRLTYETRNGETVCIEDDLPFKIPDSWEWVRLGSVISLLSGRDLEPSEYSSTPKKYAYMTGASNFDDGGLIVNRWTDKVATISHLGDLLITCKGTIGTMAFNSIGDIHIARQIMAISSTWINLNYAKIYLESIVKSLKVAASSMIPGIDRKTLLGLLFPVPPISEQERIVLKVNALRQEVKKLTK